MKRLYYRIIFSCLAILFPLSLLYAGEVETRISLNMNLGWAFHRGDIVNGEYPDLDDSSWIAATLPHIMQLEKKHCGGDIIYDGIGWYRLWRANLCATFLGNLVYPTPASKMLHFP